MHYDSENVFARILRREVPCNPVYEDEHVLAFHDAAPAAPAHVLVIPKANYVSFDDFIARASAERISDFFTAVRRIAHQFGLNDTGYRLITNHGADASQSVPHFHVHLLGGRALGGLLPGDPLKR